jgi:hypothetical protein
MRTPILLLLACTLTGCTREHSAAQADLNTGDLGQSAPSCTGPQDCPGSSCCYFLSPAGEVVACFDHTMTCTPDNPTCSCFHAGIDDTRYRVCRDEADCACDAGADQHCCASTTFGSGVPIKLCKASCS